MTERVIAGTRRSKLALLQTQHVVTQLLALRPGLKVRTQRFVTEGDRTSGPLRLAGKGAFTGALEAALLDGRIDLAVHSLKDLPVIQPEGLILGAVLDRFSARDVLVTPKGVTLGELGPGSRIGTSSQRRTAQLKAHRPDLDIIPIRGNVDTRVRKMLQGEVDALILAEAGIMRLGMADLPYIRMSLDVMLPAPGQGALAIECLSENVVLRRLLQQLDCAKTRKETIAERMFLQSLGSGCTMPVGAYARWDGRTLIMDAVVAGLDGSRTVRVRGQGKDASLLGVQLAEEACTRGALKVLRHE